MTIRLTITKMVREHHAPVGALRPTEEAAEMKVAFRQGAPRTCRCIETFMVLLLEIIGSSGSTTHL